MIPKADLPDFDSWWNAHALAAALVPAGSRVLDIGCGWGHVARWLARKGCSVVGVEPDPERLRAAAPACVRALLGRAEALDALDLEPASFDAVLFTDVLEHLPDPWSALQSAVRYLAPGGRVVISVPNFANYGVRLNVLRGRFRYQEFGVYDRTHLRFFTRETLIELVRSAGLRPAEWLYTPNLTLTGLYRRTAGRLPFLRAPARRLDRWLAYRWPGLFAVQLLVACERG